MNQLEEMKKFEEVKNAWFIRTNQRCRAYLGATIMNESEFEFDINPSEYWNEDVAISMGWVDDHETEEE